MILDVNLIPYISMNDKSTAMGIVTIGIIAEGKCHRKISITRLTIIISSIS